MTRKFVELHTFQEAWKDMGLTDDNLLELETRLLKNPQAGKVIKGTGGARKVRYEAQGKGKRGGVRVIYVDVVIGETIYFIFAYPKSVKDDLTHQETENIRKAIVVLKS